MGFYGVAEYEEREDCEKPGTLFSVSKENVEQRSMPGDLPGAQTCVELVNVSLILDQMTEKGLALVTSCGRIDATVKTAMYRAVTSTTTPTASSPVTPLFFGGRLVAASWGGQRLRVCAERTCEHQYVKAVPLRM
jgi:hypothetical protein